MTAWFSFQSNKNSSFLRASGLGLNRMAFRQPTTWQTASIKITSRTVTNMSIGARLLRTVPHNRIRGRFATISRLRLELWPAEAQGASPDLGAGSQHMPVCSQGIDVRSRE